MKKKKKRFLLWPKRARRKRNRRLFAEKRQLTEILNFEPTAMLLLEQKDSTLHISGRNIAFLELIKKCNIKKNLVGKELFEILPGLKEHENRILSVFGGAEKDTENFWMQIGEDKLFVKLIVRPWIDKEKRFVIISLIDKTKQEKAILENKELIKERELVIKQKDGVIAIVSHDLRNSFNGVIGFISLLTNNADLPKEKLNYIVSKLEQAANNQMQIVNEVLEWYRINSDNTSQTAIDVNLNEIVDGFIINNSLSAEQKEIELIHTLDEDITVFVDKHVITSVLNNLVVNAIKFSRKDNEDSRVLISATVGEEKNEVEISVKDFGIGMTTHTAENVFNVIRQKSKDGTGGEVGTGLGLINCKIFVDSYGGKIWAESEEDKGTTFSFTIPLKED